MRRSQWISLVICVGATLVVWMQAQKLRHTSTVAAAESQQVEAAAIDHPGNNTIDLPEETRELALLRNEIVQLRSQEKEFESARRENAELILAKKTAAMVPRHQAPPGFVGKEKLSNVGYATPADAVQTFFWAMREGDFDALVASFSPGSRERQRFEQMSAEQREKLRAKLKSSGRDEFVNQLTDVGVRSEEMLSQDSIAVHVGSSLATNTVRMRLQRTPEGWKLHEPGF